MTKYCTKCGKEMSQDGKFCVSCGNPFKESEKSNSKNEVNSTKILVVLFLFILIFSIVLSSANENSSSIPNKPSAILFVKDVFNSKTCDAFLSSFNGEIINEIKEGMTLSDKEECEGELVEKLNDLNNALNFFKQCEELNKDDLNFDYIKFESIKTMPAYSDIVLCSSELIEGMYFFLNYNELKNTYKIVNVGMDNKKGIIAEREEERKVKEIENKEIELRKNPTNPAHRVSPEAFVIDEENIISELPDDNKSVWVEMVIDENTIMVSYIILKGNESIITFATVNLYFLAGLSDCYQDEATKFLKQSIEHKYVYLDGGYNYFSKNEYPDIPKKFLLKYVKIWKQDFGVSTAIVDRLYGDKHGEDEIEINTAMIRLGYAKTVPGGLSERFASQLNNYYDNDRPAEKMMLRRRLENEQEVAKVAKRGFWADDVCKQSITN